MSRGNQPRLAASRMVRWLRFSEWYHGCDAAAVPDMLTLRCSQVKRKRRPVLLATCMDDLVQVSAEDGLSGHNKGRSGGQRAARTREPPKNLAIRASRTYFIAGCRNLQGVIHGRDQPVAKP